MSIATLILAAGRSSRLGEPKQLLTQNGQTLVRRIAEVALSLEAGPVVAVLGANADRIAPELQRLPLTTLVNPDWPEGLASSLHTGLSALSEESVEAFLVLLTDQPYVTVTVLQQLITVRRQTGRGIVASRYADPGNLGVPALFDIRYKAAFLRLTGDAGARKLIQQHPDDCAEVPFPLGAVDLDTPEDVSRWRRAEG